MKEKGREETQKSLAIRSILRPLFIFRSLVSDLSIPYIAPLYASSHQKDNPARQWSICVLPLAGLLEGPENEGKRGGRGGGPEREGRGIEGGRKGEREGGTNNSLTPREMGDKKRRACSTIKPRLAPTGEEAIALFLFFLILHH